MSAPVPCTRCGAMMDPQTDGRTMQCRYCGTRMQVAIDGQQLAAGLARDLSDVERFVSGLAQALHEGLADCATIQADRGWITRIDVNLEPEAFALHREGRAFVAERKKMVRGISLKSERMALDAWVNALTEALARHANENARAAWVLGKLRG